MAKTLSITPLTALAFSPYGDVIEMDNAERIPINQGTTTRFHDLANVELNDVGGKPIISIFESQPRPLPLKLEVMERHPLGSQAFYPLQDREWLIVVSSGNNPLNIENLKAFRATGQQGINYATNVWHHPLLVMDADSRFLVVDRKGPGSNLEEREFVTDICLEI